MRGFYKLRSTATKRVPVRCPRTAPNKHPWKLPATTLAQAWALLLAGTLLNPVSISSLFDSEHGLTSEKERDPNIYLQ